MLNRLYNTTNKLLHTNIKTPVRNYAEMAAKSKLPSEYKKNLAPRILQKLVNNHQQCITDFNIIYENPKDIRLYQIGSLFTNPTQGSLTLSKEKNYKFENSTQQIKFFNILIPVKHDIHIVRNSKQYFNNTEIKNNIENASEYKTLFNQVLEELKAKSIKFKIAQSEEDFKYTGYNVLAKLQAIKDTNLLIETLSINNDEKDI